MKKILEVDFDGVCHSYTSGWCGAAVIPDPPVEGLFDFLKEAGEVFSIHISSSRSAYPEGIRAMQSWFAEYGKGHILPTLYFPDKKVAAFVALNDRAITFSGKWPEIQELEGFEPWNKKLMKK